MISNNRIKSYGKSVVIFRNAYGNTLSPGSRNVFSDVICSDRKLAVSPVDKNAKPYFGRSSERKNRFYCSSGSPAGIENVIDNNYGFTFDRKRKLRTVHDRRFALHLKIISVKRNIKLADRHRFARYRFQTVRNHFRKRNPSAFYSDKNDIVYIGDALNDMLSAQRAGLDAILIDRINAFDKEDHFEKIKSLFELL